MKVKEHGTYPEWIKIRHLNSAITGLPAARFSQTQMNRVLNAQRLPTT